MRFGTPPYSVVYVGVRRDEPGDAHRLRVGRGDLRRRRHDGQHRDAAVRQAAERGGEDDLRRP
jgi:hypothetical protein